MVSTGKNQPAGWSLRLLGGFELVGPEGTVDVPPGVQKLLAYTALQGRSVTRARVADDLWPEVDGTRAATSLRSALWRVNRLGPLLVAGPQTIRLSPVVTVDVTDLGEMAAQLRDGAVGDAPFLASFNLELLPGWQDEWVTLERERLRQLELQVLDSLVAQRVERGRLGEAVDAAIRAIRLEPLRESSHRDLIRIYVAAGNRTAALTHYEGFAKLLHRELDIAPEPATTALVQPFLRSRPQRQRSRAQPRGGGRPNGSRPA
ncbi:BTAD domain-containing putative transcriptional regulator [Phycicoccus sp. SLBN-51]|uniref:AfsR/SARP family transcriptional regulator n=1 Tax=Phycicoccus sp. SLBN-51 TaxID=2768447 RepID=UPI00114F8852|nr:BTAD domain-containing putative transcriptional regulator [Phycicoccus sp. SLBN-51]TQJ51541.1 DNA-binding SARP family transcriptional activator [Phycicoccus sp. SLBN-51]